MMESLSVRRADGVLHVAPTRTPFGQRRRVYRQAAVPPILLQGWRWQDVSHPGPLRGLAGE